jgi:glycosyltransferase involved in cell wall biosynthesis
MKRVLIFATTYFPLVGGAEVALKEITDRQPDYVFDLVCAKLRRDLSRTETIGRVVVHRVGLGYSIDKYLLPVLGPLFAIRRRLNAEFVWSLMASYGGYASLIYCWVKPKTKLLLTLQEGDPLEHYAHRAGLFSFMHKMIFRRANVVQAISRFLAEWANLKGFSGVSEVIPNGVDITKFSARLSADQRAQARRQLGFSEKDVVIITASRLSLKNAVDDLILSLAFLPEEYKALIVGVGEDEETLKKLVQEKSLSSRVSFIGKKTHNELPTLLQSSDMFCRPSLSEGLGNAFLEALAVGLPIIGTPVGGIPDFLTDGETGVFCQPRNPESIAKAVLRIQTEPGLRDRLMRNGEALVRERYEWDGIAKRICSLFDHLIKA